MMRMTDKILLSISAVVCVSLAPVLAQAHSTGFTYEAPVGEYFVDIGANRMEIEPNELTLFEFNLYPKSDVNNLAEFDSVYVTVADQKSGVVYAGAVHSPGTDVLTVMSYSFPAGGEYEMSARFDKDGDALAEVTFTVPVKGSVGAEQMLKFALLGGIIVLGTLFWMKNRVHTSGQA